MRKIQIIGNVTKDAEVKHLQGGRTVTNFDLAVNERYLKDGVKQERVYYIKCALWRDNTSIAQYITKGSKLYVEGNPDVEAYVNKEGKAVGNVKVNVIHLEFCSGGKKNETPSNTPSSTTSSTTLDTSDDFITSDPNSDLPF